MDTLQWIRETTQTPPFQTILIASLLASTLVVLVVLRRSRNDESESKSHGRRVGRRKPAAKLPPSPSKLPIVGNLHQLGNMPHLSLRRLSQKLGPIIYLKLGEIPTVVVSSAALAKQVMKTHDLALSSRPPIFSAKHLFYNCTDVVYSPYGAYWRKVRKICILELLSIRRVQSFGFVREQEVARLVDRIASAYPSPVSLTNKLALYSNDILCRVVFGRDFSQGGDYHRHGFQKMLEEYQELLGGFSVGDFFPSMEWIGSVTGMKRRLEETFRRFDLFFNEIIEEHLDTRTRRAKEEEEHKDFVDVLLDLKENPSLDMQLTMDNIKAIILDMFAAGTDTTFITLDWGMTELITNPRVMKKAQDEVRSVVGGKSVVSESDLHRLPYLKAVIKEIFRLHPPAPLLVPRESMEEVIIQGYEIPAKTRIFVNAWAIGRDPESWDDPEVFNPDRFMGSCIDFKGQDFELIPFGAGRRGCPAITFGEATIEIALAQLLHSFEWELPHGVNAHDLDMTEVFGITMHRIHELIVVAKPHFTLRA